MHTQCATDAELRTAVIDRITRSASTLPDQVQTYVAGLPENILKSLLICNDQVFLAYVRDRIGVLPDPEAAYRGPWS